MRPPGCLPLRGSEGVTLMYMNSLSFPVSIISPYFQHY